MADNLTEEVPPAVPDGEAPAPIPAPEEAPPAAPAVAEAPTSAPASAPAPAPEEAPLPEAIPVEETAEIPAEIEIVEGPEDQHPTTIPPADDGEPQQVALGDKGEMPRGDDGLETEVKAKGPVTVAEHKRLKLEKVKKMLDLEKQAMKEAMKAAAQQAEAAGQARFKRGREEGEGSRESYLSLGSEEGMDSADDIEDLKAIINEYDNMEPPAPADSDDDDDDESDTSEESPQPRLARSLKGDFLREFESLPSISDISLDSESHAETELEVVGQKSLTDVDEGHFVDPEGGEGESEESGSDPDAVAAADVTADDDSEEESESDNSSFMDELRDEEDVQEKHVVIKEEDTMAMFAVAVEANATSVPDVVVPTEAPFWYRITVEFLDKLIATVVENVEKAAYSELRLDKMKMIMGLMQAVEDYSYEKYTNTAINNAVCEYFRRNGKMMNFLQLTPEDSLKEQIRFIRAMNVVDSLMERVKFMKINYGTATHKAMIEMNSLTVLSYNEEQRLEGFMRKALVHRDMDRLKRYLDNELRRMQDMRNQVSEKRYELNLNLHNLAFVDQKVMKFERVTDTLTISQILCTNESILQLGKQLEEKSKDVSVMQSNYKKSMIEETCIREKRDMISYSLSKAKLVYDDGIDRRNKLRKELTSLQAEHSKMKAQRAKLEAKGGLLFKVALMYDYDKCMNDVLDKRDKVKKLKAIAADLTKRIFVMEREARQSSMSVRHFH